MESKIHILYADDDPTMLRMFSSSLSDGGFEVLLAHNQNEARDMARRLKPNLILLDYRMEEPSSDQSTQDFINRLKTEDETKNIPIILFTNEDLTLEAEKLLKDMGVADYIHKSTPAKELIERIRKVLNIVTP